MNQNIKLAILFLIFSFSKSFSQINDSTIVIGVIKEKSFISTDLNDCYEGSEKLISRGTKVAIFGAKKCIEPINSKEINFFIIYYQNRYFIIEKQNIIIEDSVFNKFLDFKYSDKLNFEKRVKSTIGKFYFKEDLEVQKKLNLFKTNGIAYSYCNVYDESEFTDGTGVEFEIYNPCNKVLKYVWFSLVGINAVGDKVPSKWGQSLTTLQGIGPVQPNEFETYRFEYTWFTDIVETVKVIKIKVQFMDGSFKTILNPKEVLLSDEFKEKLER